MSLFESADYRTLIRRALHDREITRRDLGSGIGRSESWLSYLFSGQRDLVPELIDPIVAYLKLDPEEAGFFAALVDLEHGSPRAQLAAKATVEATRRHRAAEARGSESVAAFSQWYVPAILELASCEGFRGDPEWIARTLHPPIAVEQAEDALRALLDLGLLVTNDGALVPATSASWSPSDLPPGHLSAAASTLHRAGLGLAAVALDAYRQNERHVSTAVFALSEDQAPVLMARLRELERELGLLASNGSGAPNRVFMLGISLFPVTDYSDSGEG